MYTTITYMKIKEFFEPVTRKPKLTAAFISAITLSITSGSLTKHETNEI
jgi:hypothetical protein